MRLSVVIPCYNMELYLGECVDSLFRQGLKEEEFEVIIVNDGSKDQTSSIAHDYKKNHSNVVVIDKENAGVGAARNSGYELAQGRFIYFLDPDDYIANQTIPLILAQAESLDTDVLSFKTRNVTGNELPESTNLNDLFEEPEVMDGISAIADRKFNNEIWWYFIKKSFLEEFGLKFIEGRWMEDAILTAEIFCAARKIAHFPLDAHRYRILPTSAMRDKTPEHYNKVIFDNANAAQVFNDLIKSLPERHPEVLNAKKRLKTRQQSFVFFLLVRLMKSDLKLREIRPLLKTFESIEAYPLNQFLGQDYDGLSYRILVGVFNRKPLIVPFMRLFRTLTGNFN